MGAGSGRDQLPGALLRAGHGPGPEQGHPHVRGAAGGLLPPAAVARPARPGPGDPADCGGRRLLARLRPQATTTPTPEQRAEAERQAREAREKAERERLRAVEQWRWGGRLPSEALRTVGGNVRGLLRFDAALVHALDTAGPEVQRSVALLAARRACAAAGLDGLDWVAAALTALAERRPLPPPFDDSAHMWETLSRDPSVPARTVGEAVPPARPPFDAPAIPGSPAAVSRPAPRPKWVSRPPVTGPAATAPGSPARPGLTKVSELQVLPGLSQLPGPPVDGPVECIVSVTSGPPDPSLRMSQPHMVTGAAEADPLQAALDAVYAAVATYGEDYQVLLDEVRAACEGS